MKVLRMIVKLESVLVVCGLVPAVSATSDDFEWEVNLV